MVVMIETDKSDVDEITEARSVLLVHRAEVRLTGEGRATVAEIRSRWASVQAPSHEAGA